MTSKEIRQQEADRYIQNEMNPEETLEFEFKMASDGELQQEVELQKNIIRAIRKQQLKKIIQKEEQKIKRSKVIRSLVSIGYLAVAASIFGFFYLGFLNNCSNLADKYYVAYANIYELPSRGGEVMHPTRADSLFFDALKQLETGNSRSAAKQLESLQNKQSELHAATDNAVKWYLSLAYLKSGKKSKAKELLKDLSKDATGEFFKEAKDLFNEIE
jgi:hypothetical protein